MNPRTLLRTVLALVLTASALQAAEKTELARITPVPPDQPIPLQDFIRRPVLDNPSLNPSGTHLATLITDQEERPAAVVVDLKTNALEYFQFKGDYANDVYGVKWLNDRRVLAFSYGLYTQDVGMLAFAYPLLRYTGASLIGVPRRDRLHPVVWVGAGEDHRGLNDTGPTRIDSSLDLGQTVRAKGLSWDAESEEINRRHILTTYPRIGSAIGAARYYSDKDGELAFAIAGEGGLEKLYRFSDGKWVLCPVDLDANFFMDAGNEKDQIVVCPRARTGKPLPLQFMNAATGQLGEVLVQDKAYDATGWLYRDRLTGIIVGATYRRAAEHTVWFDENYRAIQKLLEAAFPGLMVKIVDNNEAGNLFLVATSSDRQPVAYHWVDIVKHAAGLVKQTRPWIDSQRMQPVSVMKYQTRDGRSLDAYVMLPAGATKANPPPLVVIPPPDIWARYSWDYDTFAQLLASRGYAVLRPNHRGSEGYNWMFSEEDRYDFLKMSDDITDATTTLLKTGLVDAKRVGIAGRDTGAYFVAEGIVRQPDLYRCAVTINGLFDWGTFLSEMKYFQYQSNSYSYLRRKLGDPKTEKEKFRVISPVNFMAQAHAAVFVAQDKADSGIYRAQSDRLVSELERNHLIHETYFAPEVVLPKDQLAKQVEQDTRIEAFLAKNLMGK